MVNPILRWVGGKSRLVSKLIDLLPNSIGTYHELFFGSGALFFAIEPKHAVINDLNKELMTTYRAIKNFPKQIHKILMRQKNTEENYYLIRSMDWKMLSPSMIAARMIYLNRTSFKSLYRVNKNDMFNTPYGHKPKTTYPTLKHLQEVSKILSNDIHINEGWYSLVRTPKKGDFIYLDPPYYGMYSQYTPHQFMEPDHKELAQECRAFDSLGINFMVSNIDRPEVRHIYRGFNIDTIDIAHTIKSGKQQTRREVVVTNY